MNGERVNPPVDECGKDIAIFVDQHCKSVQNVMVPIYRLAFQIQYDLSITSGQRAQLARTGAEFTVN
ncbi:uncharacterized protein N7483_004946 [Penicillium malachiteum]|uniref:uncharacterized protein n=1 Tax=Penicillium malachiteum TaxID=1324776 RepID=UPI002546C0D9|nr:uncharacterized protein N7483_004946 [Penicillium malachiteum]KAJ5730438.1 hypothetical protein N7483_004946 [Penicillium malachiteum]